MKSSPVRLLALSLATAVALAACQPSGDANTAAGTRDKNTEIYVELEALDGRTSQPMVRVVRKGHGLELENDSEQLSLATLRPALDVWARDARSFQP